MLEKPAQVSMMVYDLQGRVVASLLNAYVPAGQHSMAWNGSGLENGVYFCRMRSGNQLQIRKMMIIE
jgi:hypothetical protein